MPHARPYRRVVEDIEKLAGTLAERMSPEGYSFTLGYLSDSAVHFSKARGAGLP